MSGGGGICGGGAASAAGCTSAGRGAHLGVQLLGQQRLAPAGGKQADDGADLQVAEVHVTRYTSHVTRHTSHVAPWNQSQRSSAGARCGP